MRSNRLAGGYAGVANGIVRETVHKRFAAPTNADQPSQSARSTASSAASTGSAIELFVHRGDAEAVVDARWTDEPEHEDA